MISKLPYRKSQKFQIIVSPLKAILKRNLTFKKAKIVLNAFIVCHRNLDMLKLGLLKIKFKKIFSALIFLVELTKVLSFLIRDQ